MPCWQISTRTTQQMRNPCEQCWATALRILSRNKRVSPRMNGRHQLARPRAAALPHRFTPLVGRRPPARLARIRPLLLACSQRPSRGRGDHQRAPQPQGGSVVILARGAAFVGRHR